MRQLALLLLVIGLFGMAACGGGGGGNTSSTSSNGGGAGGGGSTPAPLPAPAPLPTPPSNPTRAPFLTGAEVSTPAAPSSVARRVTSNADAGSGTLREALAAAAAGEVIGFSASLAGKTIALTSTLAVERSLTINAADAPGLTINGGGAVRLFYVTGGETPGSGAVATFVGLKLRGGRAVGGGNSPGGAIQTGKNVALTVRHCRFDDNVADIGGAVRAGYGTYSTIEDSTFVGNDGSGANNGFSAGAIATDGHGELVVRRCWFERNHGNSGGAIYNLLQPLAVEDCIFFNNDSTGPGAAVFTDQGNWVGPGATVGGSIAVRRCWIESNQAHEMGGALFLWANELDTVLVEDSVLLDNRVGYGGAWHDSKGGGLRTMGILTIRRCAFVTNHCEEQGGGAWLDGAGPILIENTTFSGNSVTNDQGGALTLNSSGSTTISIRFCTIVDNTAGRACGGFWFGDQNLPITISSSVVANNRATTDHLQDQVGYQPRDGGGNIEFPAPVYGARKVAAGSAVVDPQLDPLGLSDHMYVRQPQAGSPALNAGVSAGAPSTDARGAPRDVTPDSGACERIAVAPAGG